MITDIVLGGLIILAGLLMVLFAESINEFRDRGVIFYRFGGGVMILLGLRVICYGV